MNLSLLASTGYEYIKEAAKPLYVILNTVIPVIVGVGCGLLLLFAIVKFVVAAKAEDDGEAAKKRKQGIWCLVTMLIFVVLVVLYTAFRNSIIEQIGNMLDEMEDAFYNGFMKAL